MQISSAGSKTICVPAPSTAVYQKMIKDGRKFRQFLNSLIEKHPKLFPQEIKNGYWLHDSVHSKKLNITTQRIKLVSTQSVYHLSLD